MNLFLPKTSDNDAAGKLTSMPGIVEAAAMNPVSWVGVLRCEEKKGSTGSFDIVELRIAKAPIRQRIQKYPSKIFRSCKFLTVVFLDSLRLEVSYNSVGSKLFLDLLLC